MQSELLITIIGVGMGFFGTLQIFILKNLSRVNKEILRQEVKIIAQVSEMVSKEKRESILGHRRADVMDRIVGDITEQKFNSRPIAEGKAEFPNLHTNIRKLLFGSDK